MNQKDQETFLTTISATDFFPVYDRGYAWLAQELLPQLSSASAAPTIDKGILADCWHLVGEIHDFNHAPKKALAAFRKAIDFDPELVTAYLAVTDMLEQTGAYYEAFQYLNQAIEKDAEEESLLHLKQRIQDNMNYNHEPLYTSRNVIWSYDECMANGDFNTVIEAIEKEENKTVDLLRCLGRAYGGLGETALYLKTWEDILALQTELEIDFSDWFYMPQKVYEGEAIWLLFKAMNQWIMPSVFLETESLEEHYGIELTLEEQRAVVCDYHIYWAKKDQDSLQKMQLRFPEWEVIKKRETKYKPSAK